MFRFTSAVCTVFLGSLAASPFAIGQAPAKVEGQLSRPANSSQVKFDHVYDDDDHESLTIVRGESPRADEALQQDSATQKAPAKQSTGQAKTFEIGESHVTTQPFGYYIQKLNLLEMNLGLGLSDADDALRSQLEIPAGIGVVVTGVTPGSPADKAGFKKNDVILEVDDQKAGPLAQVRKALIKPSKDPIKIDLIREGKSTRLTLVGPNPGLKIEAANYWLGVPVFPVDATLRAHLSSLPLDTGLLVNDVVKDSPAEQASIRKNDILITMDAKPLKVSEDLIAQIQATEGKPVPVTLLRAGKTITVSVTPAKKTDWSLIHSHHPNLDGQSRAPIRYQVVRPNLAIGVQNASTRSPSALSIQPGQEGKGEIKAFTTESKLRLSSPNQVIQATPGQKSFDLVFQPKINESDSTARIEAQLKEVTAKLEAITKALEGLKK